MQLRILSAADVRAAIDMPAAIEEMRGAFRALSAGQATVPVRLPLETEHGVTLFMPAHLGDRDLAGAKVVSVNSGNAGRGLPVINGLIMTIDPVTGVVTSLMDGTWLTALRTGAVGGLAADLLSRPDARTVALFGAGVQARTQLEAVRCVRSIEEVRVVSSSTYSAEILADELTGVEAIACRSAAEAIAGADIVITATSSSTPVFDGALVEPGTHVTGVGSFTTEMREVDTNLITRARVIVDQREAILEEAGDIVGPIRDGAVDESVMVAEIGEVVAGLVAGRTSPEEVTYFKSVGNAVQDVAVGSRVLRVAEERGLGVLVEV
jgi:ornithine cyclodeaminase